MRLRIASSGRTITGRRRRNEDALLLAPEAGVYAVLDGMGGYAGGEVASALAAETIAEFFTAVAADPDATWPYAIDPNRTLAQNRVDAAIRLANRRIRARRREQLALAAMGSTVALLSVVGSRAVLGHVGDSRIYRLRAGEITQLTRDHSLHEQLRSEGVPVPPLAEFIHANVITRALGPCEDERPELAELELGLGDRLLLCTDGLSGALADPAIAELLGRGDPQQACDALIDAAFTAGSRDNITAIVTDVIRG